MEKKIVKLWKWAKEVKDAPKSKNAKRHDWKGKHTFKGLPATQHERRFTGGSAWKQFKQFHPEHTGR